MGEFFEGGEVHQGYIKPHGGKWVKVPFADVGGLAVFQGCIILGRTTRVLEDAEFVAKRPELQKLMDRKRDLTAQGAGIRGEQYRWPNRTIPYTIDPDVPKPERVTKAIAIWEANTSIRFVRRTAEEDFVQVIRDNRGCASPVGRQGGRQMLYLGDFCSLGNAIHELGHTIGLWHEHCRNDRDQHIAIALDKVKPSARFNFETRFEETVDLGSYDFESIMHYPVDAFAVVAGTTTIKPKASLPAGVKVGQRDHLSAGDIASIEQLYAGIPQTALAASA
jgi:hypothetical protein